MTEAIRLCLLCPVLQECSSLIIWELPQKPSMIAAFIANSHLECAALCREWTVTPSAPMPQASCLQTSSLQSARPLWSIACTTSLALTAHTVRPSHRMMPCFVIIVIAKEPEACMHACGAESRFYPRLHHGTTQNAAGASVQCCACPPNSYALSILRVSVVSMRIWADLGMHPCSVLCLGHPAGPTVWPFSEPANCRAPPGSRLLNVKSVLLDFCAERLFHCD